MDDRLTISTPEQVAFHYEVAGVPSRIFAAFLDHLILGVVLQLIWFGADGIASWKRFGGDSGDAGVYWTLAIITILVFLLVWSYFTLSEIVWNGQTLGKLALMLRVIRRDGQPIGAGEALIRNLVRLVDFLPVFYGIGLICMLLNRDARRLGDLP